MRVLFSVLFQHLRRRGESGQSVILLAIGFVALLGFVGITTDVSLMFVRYAQLSRAVDSAAIAAANQMRQDRSLATVGLAARQFIEFHGLDPETVWVDTCLTVTTQGIGDPDYEELCTEEQSKLVRVKAYLKQPTVFMRILGISEFELLASAVSQTAALDVVIIMDVSESMLTETSYEDWAATYKMGALGTDPTHKNWGVIYRPPTTDTIARRLVGTAEPAKNSPDYPAWETSYLTNSENIWSAADGMLNVPQITVNNRLTYGSPGDAINGTSTSRRPEYLVEYDTNFFADIIKFPPGQRDKNIPPAGYGTANHPREECRIRYYPAANQASLTSYQAYYYDDPATTDVAYLQRHLQELYAETGLSDWPNSESDPTRPARYRFDAFVPAYNFYGCCNDPDGDGSFDDLNCQPFKQARDATFKFIERIDFVRGDRAAFVTFDRGAFLINPFGEDATGNTRGAMLDNYSIAYETLRDLVGVRAEPNFYQYEVGTNPDAIDSGWVGFSAGVLPGSSVSIPIDYGDNTYNVASDDALAYTYPVYDNCPFRNASLAANRTLFDDALANISLPNSAPNVGGLDGTGREPGQEWDKYISENNGNYPLLFPPSVPGAAAGARSGYNISMSYEFWASCRGTNMGAALREGNNALSNPNTSRRFGTVWVMVLLSDGAAGGSDPVRRNGGKLDLAQPYREVSPGVYGLPGEYGAFGLCPIGTRAEPGELMLIAGDLTRPNRQGLFPFCSDEAPETRHDCDFRPFQAKRENNPALIYDADYNANDPTTLTEANIYDADLQNCDPLYDVDDYARDWADVIGLTDIQPSDDTLLPTIFTIGFGLGFNNFYVDPKNPATSLVTDPSLPINNAVNIGKAQENVTQLCEINIANCLGEQLLRYIADVGDNNRIDDDYWQDWLEERLDPTVGGNTGVDGYLEKDTFGVRGACQTDEDPPNGDFYHLPNDPTAQTEENFRLQWGALSANQNCGNYYFAPGGPELQFVFDDIASRMFTRLSR